jgi:hypothetical protein
MKIVMLTVPQEGHEEESAEASLDQRKDLTVSFDSAVETAVQVALDSLEHSSKKKPKLRDAIDILKSARDGEEGRGPLFGTDAIELLAAPGAPTSFDKIAPVVNSSFACLVDLEGQEPHAYFWLGYCHARAINVIPIHREAESSADDAKAEEDGGSAGERGSVLAFDIRALWYMSLKKKELKSLAGALQGVFEELIVRDVPRLQRNVFWERLTRTPRIHIYTGAVHNERLTREMVGDWDLRTASELVRYLSSEEESVIPELEVPIYSPATVRDKLSGEDLAWNDRRLNEFVQLIERKLEDENCLIIASADVNPITEVALAHAYGLDTKSACFHREFHPRRMDNAVIALKETTSNAEDDGESLLPFFAGRMDWVGPDAKLRNNYRGFLVDKEARQLPYRSQDEADEEFSVLAHLVIMKNPFGSESSDKTLVILNGVSGPGTFGLAEVLTGGTLPINEDEESPATGPKKTSHAEKLLQRINERWNECQQSDGKYKGVEAVIKVKIRPMRRGDVEDSDAVPAGQASPAADMQQVQEKFYDKREVIDWRFWGDDEGESHIRGGNPRVFPD